MRKNTALALALAILAMWGCAVTFGGGDADVRINSSPSIDIEQERNPKRSRDGNDLRP